MRLIDAEALEKEMLFWSDVYGYGGLTKDNIREILRDEKKSPTVNKWTPCSERVPEKIAEYITTIADKEGSWVTSTEIGYIKGRKCWGVWHEELCEYLEEKNVIAWMPLPEPYKEN